MDIREKLRRGRIFFDGGYGTCLQERGLEAGELPEIWNITHPDTIKALHSEYLEAGSDVITTNTFGANILKFPDREGDFSLEKIISSAVLNAKNAIRECGGVDKYIALDIGPTGKLLKPLGDLDFEDAVKVFGETIRLGVKNGVDLIIIDSMNDSFETKAAVLAAKENCDLPIFVTNAYDMTGELMTGASPSAMTAMLEGLRVDALGINCSLGPEKMLPIIEELVNCSSTPVIVNPNAGMPVVKDGKTVFEVTPEEFAKTMTEIAELGATVLGGGCGTTPQHIKALRSATENLPFKMIEKKDRCVISSYRRSVVFDKKPVLIGERINPTGKPRFKTALREKNYEYILNEGVAQQDAGADVLDVNVGLPEIDETEILTNTIKKLQTICELPLQLDTSSPEAMEKALRIYNGKPLINSVNGKKESMDAVFPIAKKYGGVIIALTLDEDGIPETAEGRMAIADKIINEAEKYGISKNDLIFDPLAMTISTDTKSAGVTLQCIKELGKRGIKTSLGVSNISFGLPKRNIINSTFFAMAMQCGLSAAIMNPHSKEMMDAYYSFCALSDLDNVCERYINYATDLNDEKAPVVSDVKKDAQEELIVCIVKGLKDSVKAYTEELLKTREPLEIINNAIIPALDKVGDAFEKKQAFLPQLLISAEAAKTAFEIIKSRLSDGNKERSKKCKIVLATVKGDIHDIGKNIVKVLLENYDYDVIDLGKDVPPELVATTAKEKGAKIVGLSALMTTTVPAMEETIKSVRREVPDAKIVVGGAVLTQEYADMIGADKYAKDAMETVRYAETIGSI